MGANAAPWAVGAGRPALSRGKVSGLGRVILRRICAAQGPVWVSY